MKENIKSKKIPFKYFFINLLEILRTNEAFKDIFRHGRSKASCKSRSVQKFEFQNFYFEH
jgi:hypothetical protein